MISRLEAFITQIAYVSDNIKGRIDKAETLTMLTKNQLVEESPNQSQMSNKMPNSILVNGKNSHLTANNVALKPIKNVSLNTIDADECAIPSITKYFSAIYENKCKKMKSIENLFKAVGPILIKLESLVLNTSNGKLNHMHLYYDFWNNQLSQLLCR